MLDTRRGIRYGAKRRHRRGHPLQDEAIFEAPEGLRDDIEGTQEFYLG